MRLMPMIYLLATWISLRQKLGNKNKGTGATVMVFCSFTLLQSYSYSCYADTPFVCLYNFGRLIYIGSSHPGFLSTGS